MEIVGHPRQARMLGDEVEQRNLAAFGLCHCIRRQQLAHRGVESDCSSLDQLG
jgi:hypothetical protein